MKALLQKLLNAPAHPSGVYEANTASPDDFLFPPPQTEAGVVGLFQTGRPPGTR